LSVVDRIPAARAGVLDHVETRQVQPASLGIGDLGAAVDFTLAFAVVHELPSPASFFREVASVSKPAARLLLVEPKGHVTPSEFENELRAAREAGFLPVDTGGNRGPNTALLEVRKQV